MGGWARNYARRVWQGINNLYQAADSVSVERDQYSIAIERKGAKVWMYIRAEGFKLDVPMHDQDAWLVGGRLMDAAHEASAERSEAPE